MAETKLSKWATPISDRSDPGCAVVGLLTSSIPAAFRAFLLSTDPTGDPCADEYRSQIRLMVGDRIHYQHVPEFSADQCNQGILPYVWYRQSGTLRDRCLDSYDPLPHVVILDVEVWTVDPAIGETIETYFAYLFESFTGMMGDIQVEDVLVENQDDDYVYQGISADYGLFAQAFQLDVYPDWST